MVEVLSTRLKPRAKTSLTSTKYRDLCRLLTRLEVACTCSQSFFVSILRSTTCIHFGRPADHRVPRKALTTAFLSAFATVVATARAARGSFAEIDATVDGPVFSTVSRPLMGVSNTPLSVGVAVLALTRPRCVAWSVLEVSALAASGDMRAISVKRYGRSAVRCRDDLS